MRPPMPLKTFNRQLRLLTLLAGNRTMDVRQVAAHMQMGRRQIYRYLELLVAAGFEFENNGGVYRLKPSSPFYRELRQRMSRPASSDILHADAYDARYEHNLQHMCEAIEQQRQVTLQGYHSQNSQTVRDRRVEPYYLFEDNDAVRCYEPESGMCKTFRLSRASVVEILPQTWEHPEEHTLPHTDLWGYTSAEPRPVTLRLTPLAYQLLTEEYHVEEGSVETLRDIPGGPARAYLLHTSYCHPFGIGRFVMGLPADIQVLDSPELEHYIEEQIAHFTKK